MAEGRKATPAGCHGFVSQTSNACKCGLMLADCDVASAQADVPGRTDNWDGTFTPAQQALYDEIETNTTSLMARLGVTEDDLEDDDA